MSKSKLFIGGRASLLGRSQHIPGTHQYQHIPLPSWRLQRRHGFRGKCNNYNLTSLLPTSGFWPSGRQSKRFANAVCSRFEFQVGLPQAHETQPRPDSTRMQGRRCRIWFTVCFFHRMCNICQARKVIQLDSHFAVQLERPARGTVFVDSDVCDAANRDCR